MGPDEKSVKMLELKMHQQLSLSSKKEKPENIPYYISSAMLRKENIAQSAASAAEHAQKLDQVHPKIQHIEVSASMAAQYTKAINKYENFLCSIDAEESSENKKTSSFSARG